MGARPGVLRLECAGEGRNGLEVGTLEQLPLATLDLEQVPEVARVEQQLLLRSGGPPLGRPERDAIETARETLRDGEELERAERLANEGVGADALRRAARAV